MRTYFPGWLVLAVLSGVVLAAPGCGIIGHGAIQPVASGPTVVVPGKVYTVALSSGTTTGTWTVAWGDGQTVKAPGRQTTAEHVYAEKGVYSVRVTFAETDGAAVAVRRDYPALVRVVEPLLYLGFDENLAVKPRKGAARHTGRGDLTRVPSLNPSLSTALGLSGEDHLDLPEQKMREGDFFGFEFWLKTKETEKRQIIFAGRGNEPGNVRVFLEKGALCFELVGSGVKSVPMSAALSDGGWHQFGVSYERSRYYKTDNVVRFYRDGLLVDEQKYAAGQSRPVSYEGATIAASQDNGGVASGFLKGSLDEIVLHPLGIFPAGFLERYRAATAGGCAWNVAVGADGAEVFTVDEPVITHEVPVPLSPDPTVDCLPVLQAAVDKAEPGTRLKIINATTGRSGGLFQLRSRDAHWRLLTIRDKTDLEIDGGGAGFVVRHAATKYVEITRCTRVALRNMDFDIDQTQDRPGVYARVEKIEPESGRLHLQYVQGNPLRPDIVPKDMKHWRWRRVDGLTRKLSKDGLPSLDIKTKVADRSDGSRWVFTLTNPPSGAVWKSLAALAAKQDLLQINNAHFGGSGVSLYDGCRHLTFERVNFYGVMGMVFLSSDFDYLRVSRCTIGLPPGMTAEDRPFSACADGFHFHEANGGHVIFEDNDVAMTDDDAVSIKDGVYRNVSKVTDSELWVGGGLQAGTSVELRTLELEPLKPPFSATILTADNAAKTVRLDRAIPGKTGGKFHLLNTSKKTANWIIRGNNIHDLNGRMMLYTNSGTVTRNRIDGIYCHLGFSAADFDNAGRTYDVVLGDNLIVNAPGDTSVWGARPAVPVFDDITLHGNSLIRSRWAFHSMNGLFLTGNYVERSGASGASAPAIKAAGYSRGVEAVDNLQYCSGGAALIEKDATSDDVQETGTAEVP